MQCSFLLKIYLFFYFMCISECSACICLYHMYAGPVEARKGTQIPWNWSNGWLGATMWVLGAENRTLTSAGASSAHSPCAISPALSVVFLRVASCLQARLQAWLLPSAPGMELTHPPTQSLSVILQSGLFIKSTSCNIRTRSQAWFCTFLHDLMSLSLTTSLSDESETHRMASS